MYTNEIKFKLKGHKAVGYSSILFAVPDIGFIVKQPRKLATGNTFMLFFFYTFVFQKK